MKILFFGDSITDAGRNRETATHMSGLGWGFVRVIADRLLGKKPKEHEIINCGISGNRVVDLYARVKSDVWNLQPDIVSVLVGVNDVWHEIARENGVNLERFENIYRILIQDTKKALPNVKMILCEPFVLKGTATVEDGTDKFERFCAVYDYAKVVKKLAKEFDLPFVALQDELTKAATVDSAEDYLTDGVHPHIAGATLIADEWVKVFESSIDKR